MARADVAGRSGRRVNAGADTRPDGLRRKQVAETQRARMLRAMLQVCAEHGWPNVTVALIVKSAGVSRRTFYELFDDVEDCFLTALDDAHRRLGARVVPAWRQPGSWRERVRGALVELLAFLDRDPLTGRLVVIEALAAGPRALERRSGVLAHAVVAVEEGRTEAKQSHDPPSLTGEGIVGAVASVIYGRMLRARTEPLLALTGPLMSMIVLPYLGPAAAERELVQPTPKTTPKSGVAPAG
jgi:AcrR family transcriptional regulator